jgi:hypothetical protein
MVLFLHSTLHHHIPCDVNTFSGHSPSRVWISQLNLQSFRPKPSRKLIKMNLQVFRLLRPLPRLCRSPPSFRLPKICGVHCTGLQWDLSCQQSERHTLCRFYYDQVIYMNTTSAGCPLLVTGLQHDVSIWYYYLSFSKAVDRRTLYIQLPMERVNAVIWSASETSNSSNVNVRAYAS